MSVVSDFKKSKEYKNYTQIKKDAFDKEVIAVAHRKSPRVTDLSVLDVNDLKAIKGKLKKID